MADRRLSITVGDETHRVAISDDGRATIDGVTVSVAAAPAHGEFVVTHETTVERVFAARTGDTTWIFHNGETFELTIEADGASRRRQQAAPLAAPMPATVVSVHAKVGDRVARGATLIVLEAMKMELPVRAAADGVVKAVNCSPGDLVQPGTPLIEMQ
ncbi:MAG TPA: biotin/lipoyl-containing protein [Vicinamibacterales bacterium]|jgi:3-methylcrotonyl-CoA carboxylase alpha subunit